ncbi:MGDG synthase family glycosyltransferase [Alkalibacillus aidingensis]|uniref:MGDG synthase family glycosyltransferase n=1 Tax=Alkalibacillus aidingensis TaxID=2747607 RepID=UPI0016615B6F|nr:UDP-glucuronosyltransferase [Alkalibacillus aidingensis]
MGKVLFLPFLQIKTGHHHVAEALSEGLKQIDPQIECVTKEVLHDRFGNLEKIVSETYLSWIHHFPNSYNWLYHQIVYRNLNKETRYYFFELLFLNKIKEIINNEKPDLIVCTHALPSYMVHILKKTRQITMPVVNVYTDFFVHKLWGTTSIDYHFVATNQMKEYLTQRRVHPSKIFITGIPTHPEIRSKKPSSLNQQIRNILIAGGNLGLGCEESLTTLPETFNYTILCGRNHKFYQALKQLNQSNLTPLTYIDSKSEMNKIYDQSDIIITKPGGVTISECLIKRIPVFVNQSLPGQEQINLHELDQLGLIFRCKNWSEDLEHILNQKDEIKAYYYNLQKYHEQTINETPFQLLYRILKGNDFHLSQSHTSLP